MKRRTITLLMCLVAACACVALAGCQSQAYQPQAKDPTVSASALGEAGILRVGVNSEVGPLAGVDTEGNFVGVDVDVAAYLADQLGCKLKVVDVKADAAKALSDGTVDMVLGIDTSETEAAFWRSSPYLSTGVALFGSASESAVPTPDSKPKIAAQAASKSAWRVTNLFGEDSLVSKEDLKGAFADIASGSTRYVAADAIAGSYVSYIDNDQAKIVAMLQDPSGYCAAISQSNTELQGAISMGIDQLVNGGMMSVIEAKWLGKSLDLGGVTVVKSAVSDEKAEKSEESSEDEEAEATEEEAPAEEAPAEEAPVDDGGYVETYDDGGYVETYDEGYTEDVYYDEGQA